MSIARLQADPHGKDPHASGAKLDAGKAPIWKGVVSYFPRALKAIAEVSEFGSRKYVWGGWKSVPEGVNRYTDALLRHLIEEACDEAIDPETELAHAAHAAWNALARLELLILERQAANENG